MRWNTRNSPLTTSCGRRPFLVGETIRRRKMRFWSSQQVPDSVRDFLFKRHYQVAFAFEREVRANNNQKQNTVTLRRGAEASSSLKRNKWGQPVGGNVYAGFELELAGAERSGARSRNESNFRKPRLRWRPLHQTVSKSSSPFPKCESINARSSLGENGFRSSRLSLAIPVANLSLSGSHPVINNTERF